MKTSFRLVAIQGVAALLIALIAPADAQVLYGSLVGLVPGREGLDERVFRFGLRFGF